MDFHFLQGKINLLVKDLILIYLGPLNFTSGNAELLMLAYLYSLFICLTYLSSKTEITHFTSRKTSSNAVSSIVTARLPCLWLCLACSSSCHACLKLSSLWALLRLVPRTYWMLPQYDVFQSCSCCSEWKLGEPLSPPSQYFKHKIS